MAQVEYTLTIQRPVEQVFAFVTNGENNPKWELEVVETMQLTDGPTRVGTKWLSVHQYGRRKVKAIRETIQYEPNRRWVTKSAIGPIPTTFTITFESTNGGTKLQFILNVQTTGLAKLMDPFIENIYRRQAPINFRRLKEVLET
jgi:uncharacterized protein YndB with AHSA1/START domain